jgi:cytochrome c-type biogenesis protein CcmH/NrfG
MSARQKKNRQKRHRVESSHEVRAAADRGRQVWALAAVAVILATIVYANVSDGPFVYDDRLTVTGNPSIRELTDLRAIVLYDLFRPVVNLSYAVDFARSGLDPSGYHFTNVLFHAVNVALLFWLALVLARDRGHREDAAPLPETAPAWIAFSTAALFAVHPMMTEAVTYISGRSELLCTTFVLASLLGLRRFLLRGSLSGLAVGLTAFVLGLASKENAAMVPFVLLAGELLLFPGDSAVQRKRLIRWHLPFVGLITVAGLARVAVFMGVERGAGAVGLWHNALTEVGVVWRYLGLLLLPVGQSIMHPVATVTRVASPSVVFAVLGLGFVAGAVIFLRSKLPLLCFGLAWFFLLLAPAHVIPLQEAMAEHRVYSASCGFFMAIAVLGVLALERAGRRVPLVNARVGLVVLGAAIVLLAVATTIRNRAWADPVVLWGDAARQAPDTWGAQYAFADALRGADRCEEAVPVYERAIALIPNELSAHLNLGICLAELGRFDDAFAAFAGARSIAPESAKVYNNLGTLAARSGRLQEAREHLLTAVRVDPGNVQARLSLVRLAETVFDDPAEAARLCREIARIDPKVPGVRECVERNERLVAQRRSPSQP